MLSKKDFKSAKDHVVSYAKAHPMESALFALSVITTGVKVLERATNMQNANTWKREVARREKKTAATR